VAAAGVGRDEKNKGSYHLSLSLIIRTHASMMIMMMMIILIDGQWMDVMDGIHTAASMSSPCLRNVSMGVSSSGFWIRR